MIRTLHCRAENCAPQPWKNGAGTTRLLWQSTDDRRLRLSLASLDQSAPFSLFPATSRLFMLTQGELSLRVNGAEHPLQAGEHLAFHGEDDVAALIAPTQACQALNLMFSDALVEDSLSENALAEALKPVWLTGAQGQVSVELASGQSGVLFCCQGAALFCDQSAALSQHGHQRYALQPAELLLIHHEADTSQNAAQGQNAPSAVSLTFELSPSAALWWLPLPATLSTSFNVI